MNFSPSRDETKFLQTISLEGAYHIDIETKVGIGQRRLPYEILGLTAREARQEGVSPATIEMFPSLRKAGSHVKNTVAKIKRKTLKASCFSVYHEDKKQIIEDLLLELKEKHEDGLVLIEDTYQEEKDRLPERITRVLNRFQKTYSTLDLDINPQRVINLFIAQFPTLDQVLSKFSYEVIVVPLPGLISAAENNNNLADTLMGSVQSNIRNRVQSSLQESIHKVQQEFYQNLKEILSDLERLGPNDRPKKIKTQFINLMDSVDSITPFLSGLDDLKDLLNKGSDASANLQLSEDNSLDFIESALSEVRQQLSDTKESVVKFEEINDGMFFL